VWTWLFFGLAIFLKSGAISLPDDFAQTVSLPLQIAAAFGPAVGAFVSLRSLNGKGAIRNYVKSFLSLNFGWKAWLLILAALGLPALAAWLIPELFGEPRIAPYLAARSFPVNLLIMIFLGGGQEEIGWRGYISPLLEEKFGLVTGPLILGMVWAVWHIPLWFIQRSSQTYTPFVAFVLVTVGYSYFFSWIVAMSGGRLFSALAAHGASNSFSGLFPFLIMENGARQTRYWIYASLVFAIGITVVALRSYRERKNAHGR
jgi:membrane protease YdiL (CAAX protease family)